MRVLWLAPWFRSLAHIYGGNLVLEGHDVQVVTSNKRSESAPPVVEEIVCPKKPYDPRWAKVFPQVERLYGRFRPDVVIAEEITDPVFALLRARMRPRWLAIHDASPHDETYELQGVRKLVQVVGRQRADHILTFSEYVAREVGLAEWSRHSKIHRVKLLSDVRDEDVPQFRPTNERNDFVLMGRIRPYKNVDHVLRAWTAHVNGAHYRGDRLVIWGKGSSRRTENADIRIPDGASVKWRDTNYRYSDIQAGRFSGFKGNLCVYSEASQSGIQVLSAQLGVAPIVSNVGALPEYQASSLPTLDPTDIEGLVDALNCLADPETAVAFGQIARARYMHLNAGRKVGKELAAMLERSVGDP